MRKRHEATGCPKSALCGAAFVLGFLCQAILSLATEGGLRRPPTHARTSEPFYAEAPEAPERPREAPGGAWEDSGRPCKDLRNGLRLKNRLEAPKWPEMVWEAPKWPEMVWEEMCGPTKSYTQECPRCQSSGFRVIKYTKGCTPVSSCKL